MARVWARTMAVKSASRWVMEKVGLRYVRTFHDAVEYALSRADYNEDTCATGG
ncbi:MAG TPA: hypothetical protein VGD84_23410 [Pseudonocardiaceae bacterium]